MSYGGISYLEQTRICVEARRVWGSSCPCCGREMRAPSKLEQGDPQPDDWRTRGHDRPRRVGPGHSGHRAWLHVCRRCNAEQADRTFALWAFDLMSESDPRASRVAEVAVFIRGHTAPRGEV